MGIHFTVRENIIIIFGDTYRQKDAIKALGGKFDGVFKNWQIPFSDDALTKVQTMASAGRTQSGNPTLAASATQNEELGMPPAGMPVRDLVSVVHQTITTTFPSPVWVIGEIENISVHQKGIFLNLAEPKSSGSISVKATIWPAALEFMARVHGEDTVRQVIQDGIQVRCLCKIGFYKDRAQLSLTIENIDPAFTQGTLALAREKLLKELRAKGLDRKNKMLLIPDLPLCTGLVSAAGSRAEGDFIHQLESSGYPGKVLFAPAATQGDQVTREVPAAIAVLAMAGCDLIVITRGGGSAADLRWFDTPEVAYAIANCTVPVIAAIGHHDDTCVAEEICHIREKTPTAAAQHIINLVGKARQRIETATGGLQTAIARMTQVQLQLFANLDSRLQAAAVRAISLLSMNLANIETRLAGLDPAPWLERGWTQLSQNGKTIASIATLRPGTLVRAHLKDGHVALTVTSTVPYQSAGNAGAIETNEEKHP
jgi:exodeoxyribonuclease VII large subunit